MFPSGKHEIVVTIIRSIIWLVFCLSGSWAGWDGDGEKFFQCYCIQGTWKVTRERKGVELYRAIVVDTLLFGEGVWHAAANQKRDAVQTEVMVVNRSEVDKM